MDVGEDEGAGVDVRVSEVVGVAEVRADVGTTTTVVVGDEDGNAEVDGWT